MNQDLLSSLNAKQHQAVTAPEESVLILAGAGSGKTRVLTTRIAYLLNEHLASTSEIMAVTFTNKAAKEMLTRLENMLPYDLRRMWVGTFHGLCNRILRRHADYAALPKTFQILDSADQLSLIKRVMKAANVDPERVDPKGVQSYINWCKENGLRASQAAGTTGKDSDGAEKLDLYLAYEKQCQREGVVDFAELLLRCYELLERNELVRVHYLQRFRHILVDEFQDTNVLQYRWLKLLAGCGLGENGRSLNAVFAVGDDDQSIYAFRGANVGNMADFLRDFHVSEPIRLEENYRSTGTILDAANGLISQNSGRLGKNLWTAGARGDRIVVEELNDDREEAQWVVQQIRAERSRDSGYRDFAVLYRMNAQSRVMEGALAAAGIPYRVYGGLRFFERAEVKHVLAYLRLLTNPWDDTSFLRVVNFPTRGIGAKTIEALTMHAQSRGVSLWAALCDEGFKATPKLLAFRDMIEKMRLTVDSQPLLETIKYTIAASGLRDHYMKEREGEDRVANMDEIISAASGYLENEKIDPKAPAFVPFHEDSPTPIEGFLTQATLEAGDKNEDESVDAVQLMTVHAAKGLEFKNVYIIGVEEGIFPHFSATKDEKNARAGLEEERRLMYVAITRAKKHLVITHCSSRMMYGNQFANPLSSFVEEIPSALLDIRKKPKRSRYTEEDDDDDWAGGGLRSRESRGAGYAVGRSSSWSGRSFGGYGSRAYGQGGTMSAAVRGASDSESAVLRQLVRKAKAHSQTSVEGYKTGMRIMHDKFGEGVVRDVRGRGDACTLIVDFGGRERELMLMIAKKFMKPV